jgi:predicted RNA-binding Zn-ribbon protein involved in translation (DUF1610 family)
MLTDSLKVIANYFSDVPKTLERRNWEHRCPKCGTTVKFSDVAARVGIYKEKVDELSKKYSEACASGSFEEIAAALLEMVTELKKIYDELDQDESIFKCPQCNELVHDEWFESDICELRSDIVCVIHDAIYNELFRAVPIFVQVVQEAEGLKL